MPIDSTTVAIVLDPQFGGELQQLAARMPVWIVDSAVNRSPIEAEWTRRRHDGAEREVTVFRMIEGMTPADHVVAMLRTIEEHHGPRVQTPPFRTLVVVGAEPTPAVVAAIRKLGGGEPVATPEGFSVHFERDS